MLVSEVGHAWPGVEGHWDLPTAGTPALSVWDSDRRQDGAAMAPTHRSGETSWWVDPAPGVSGCEEQHLPSPLPGVLLPSDARRAPSAQPTRVLSTHLLPGPAGHGEGLGGLPEHRTWPEANPAKYGQGFASESGWDSCSNQSWQMHKLLDSPEFVKLNTWKLEADSL